MKVGVTVLTRLRKLCFKSCHVSFARKVLSVVETVEVKCGTDNHKRASKIRKVKLVALRDSRIRKEEKDMHAFVG